ncbi:hypothetical protein [Flavobacterium palustre]|uniref:hypothetical protein n=1 Tax=Flavobacterium palustre TaxID=1476463 RepID=UPI0016649D31|nr:hypothetical protein [Flavobacterium palustre]
MKVEDFFVLGAALFVFSMSIPPAFAFISSLRYEDIGSIGAKITFISLINFVRIF